ncbi:MAG: PAS domain S-box protein, partial [Deltaproteobacteria bacterium]|nr:PAS domain S-box protein [Deltaproteobacteria bacterium]
KTQLLLHKKLKKELENRVEQRTGELRKTNERLQQEIAERKQAEEELKKHRDHLEELVAERTAEVRESLGRLKREIMERKQMEKSLRSSEHRFNVAFRANPAAVDITTLSEGRYIEVNDSFCRLTGYSREEIIGSTTAEIRHWAKAGHREEMISGLLKNGSVKDFETVFRSKGGRMIVVSLSAEVIDLDGKPHVLTISTDVTDRKRAEADRTRMITAFEQAAETIIIADEKGIIKYVNPAFETACGYARGEVQGKTINLLRSPDNDKNVVESAKQKLGKGEVWRGRLLNKKKDGTHFEVETSISPVKSKTGHIINFVIVERDVTDEARLERQLRQAQKMEAIGTLAGGIAHDFNNILMAMMGYAEMAKRSIFDNAAARQDLEQILLAGRRATDLVKQILTFSRKDEQEKYPVEVHRVFREALTLIRASIPSTIEIRQDIDPTTGPVLADPTQMHQLMMNLCANAYQAMEGSHGVLEVSVQEAALAEDSRELQELSLTPGTYVKLTVSDTGHGISPELMERIFDPYFTTKEAGKGTGLGLAVVLGIVRSHGGAINVKSDPGRGTTFFVYLPRCQPLAEAIPVEGTALVSGTERIMFVDDEEQIAEFGRRVLESLGYQVTAFTDPVKALETARRNPADFDLVITDLMMPNLTGVELAKKLTQI